MMKNFTKMYSPIVKRFLVDNFGFENISSYSVINDDMISFGINSLKLLLDCENMTIKRLLSSVQSQKEQENMKLVMTSFDCEICNIIERNLKYYVNNEIDKIKEGADQ